MSLIHNYLFSACLVLCDYFLRTVFLVLKSTMKRVLNSTELGGGGRRRYIELVASHRPPTGDVL